MSDSGGYEIVTYLGWCGADAAYRFKSREQYEEVCAFLDRLTGMRTRGAQVSSEVSGGNYHYIAKEEREVFEQFMKRL